MGFFAVKHDLIHVKQKGQGLANIEGYKYSKNKMSQSNSWTQAGFVLNLRLASPVSLVIILIFSIYPVYDFQLCYCLG